MLISKMSDPIVEVPDWKTFLKTLSNPIASTSIPPLMTTSPTTSPSADDSILDTFKSSQKFFHTIRGLSILLSIIIISTLVLITLGFLLCCCLKRFKRVKNIYGSEHMVIESPSTLTFDSIRSSSNGDSKSTSWKRLREATMGSNSNSTKNTAASASTGSCTNKKLLMPHKNIITPDKNLPFVVPMISLNQTHVQGSSGNTYYGTSGGNVKLPPMLEEQYFPQYHLEDSTTPQIGFSLSYVVNTQVLKVRIIGGNNFPYECEGSSHSVHIKVYPGRGNKHKTKEFPGSSPIYNQEFSFHVRRDNLRTKVLKLRVIGQNFSIASIGGGNNGRGSSFIGAGSISSSGTLTSSGSGASGVSAGKTLVGVINLALKDLPSVCHEDVKQDFKTGPIWKILEHPSSFGEGIKLEVSLKWAEEPSPGLLVMKIREAYGLHEITEAEYTTTYVKVTLQEQGRSIKNRKTRLIRWGSQPNYDDTFVVTIPHELLSQISFTLSLIARGRLGSKVILGTLGVGPVPFVNPQSGFAAGSEIWEDMCHQRNVEVSRWLPLMLP